MDYEKAYKAVLKTATQWIKDGCTDKEKICLECVFPELRESEDERIREQIEQALIEHDWDNTYEVSKDVCLAYLEKQKAGYIHPEDYPLTPDECIKPMELCEKDEKIRKSIIHLLQVGGYMSPEDKTKAFAWLEKRKEQRLAFTWRRVEDVTTKRTDEGDCVTTEKILVKGLIDDEDYRIIDKDVMVNKNLLCIPVRELNAEQKPIELSDNFEIALEEFLMNADSSSQTFAEEVKKYANKLREIVCKEQKPAECINIEKLAEHIKAEFESFRNLLKKKGIDYQPAEVYWTDFARLFVSSTKKLQKPAAWSEEDKMNLNGCICSLHQYGYMTYADFLKHLPERFNLQSKTEWSEEYREEDLRTRFAFYTYKNEEEDGVLYLSNVFVEETSRNKGFGTKILAAAEKVAETIGAITIRLKVKQDSPANAWYRKHGYGYMAFEDGYDWLEKTLEYLKPKQEWSEGDKRKLNRIYEILGYAADDKGFLTSKRIIGDKEAIELQDFIKFLCLQPHWKPSEEQMYALATTFDTTNNASMNDNNLRSLYNDLKKLICYDKIHSRRQTDCRDKKAD